MKPAPDLVSREVAAHIVRYVAGEHEAERAIELLEIDPALLSLVCRELNERRRAAGLPVITAELLAGARERILADFYEQALRDLPKAVRELVEDRLITGSGHRRAEAVDDVVRAPGVTEEAISRLVDRRLLRREERLGIDCIELTHDVLTGIVRESRDTRHAAALRRKRRRRGLIAGIAVGALAGVAIALVAVFANLYYRADEQETLAKKHREKAESLINFMLFDLRDRLAPLGRLDILEPAAKQAMEYFDQGVGSDETPESARNRSVALSNVGDVWRDQGKRQGALGVYEQSLAIGERLAAQDPGNAGWQWDLAASYERMGGIRMAEGEGETARNSYGKALGIYERLAVQDPGNAIYERAPSFIYSALADISSMEQDYAEAMAAARKSIGILEKLIRENRLAATWRDNLPRLYGQFAWYALADRKPREAITAASRGIELGPGQTWIKANLAHGYLFAGDYDKAEDIYLENKNTRLSDSRSFREHVLDDFRQFRSKGLSHPDMDRVERLLQAPAAP